ncbi:MAG: hypothetical protein K8R79_07985, partial [Calditrichales bacterium]|nr:hypothetical protein [Calditrichales bacterium]
RKAESVKRRLRKEYYVIPLPALRFTLSANSVQLEIAELLPKVFILKPISSELILNQPIHII